MTRPGRWVLTAALVAVAGGTVALAAADAPGPKPTVTVYKTPT
jgi:hypothetical protein